MTAWYRTMQSSSKAAQDIVANANGAKVKLEGLTASANTSKLALVGLRIATVDLNMALTMGISFAIQEVVTGLDNLVLLRKMLLKLRMK